MKNFFIILILITIPILIWIYSKPNESFYPDQSNIKNINKDSPSILLSNVPFTSQAPNGDWDNMMFQQGCEEASILMAIYWAKDKEINKEIAMYEIQNISKFEEVNYGDYYDRSAFDTTKLIRDYFSYNKIKFVENITTKDIITELKKGNLIITPTNGQALKNPFYTPPGPERHMLVIIGYDAETDEIITNDPGTKRGENFRYDRQIFENALRDFPTGIKKPITKLEKNMIVIEPSKE